MNIIQFTTLIELNILCSFCFTNDFSYSFQSGDLILLVFDERYENYLVLTTGQTLFFLHPDSMAGLDLATSEYF